MILVVPPLNDNTLRDSLKDEGKHWVIIRLKDLRELIEFYKSQFSATVAYNSLTFLTQSEPFNPCTPIINL
ncbi:hypothetical protein cce_1815 [Crocosphaera subtropica ATCC 51142]|uniref:Uncharacterized protein n=1 Tax=Crocosphaera subtropica (strain ATCC 51142 / BH68) TaxID=43989 RepID=B1WZL3_CROS5|nr:hypothetical protein cce_1815 [Crocosphaera subtropica ATCC 51142]